MGKIDEKVEAERAFAAAGLFVTKMRCRLSKENIDELCFLRKYFLNSTNGRIDGRTGLLTESLGVT